MGRLRWPRLTTTGDHDRQQWAARAARGSFASTNIAVAGNFTIYNANGAPAMLP